MKLPRFRKWIKLARVNTLPQSVVLVMVGATLSVQNNGLMLPNPNKELAMTAALTAASTTQAMLVNDYQDYMLERDTVHSKPNKPMVTRQITPSVLRNTLLLSYTLIPCCTHAHLQTAKTKIAIHASNVLLFLYTRYIKPLTALKNIFCGAVVSMAIGTGAWSVGGTIQSVWRPMLSVFGTICHREVLMDIRDLDGDRASNIRTLPVVFGVRKAIYLSFIPLLATIGAANSVSTFVTTLCQIARAALLLQDTDNLETVIESIPAFLLFVLLSHML